MKETRIEGIAPLAWCAKLEKGTLALQLSHGRKVETREEGFVEGAWDGAFSTFQFDQADFLLGSGGKRVVENGQQQFLFAAPSHTLERLYAIKAEESLYVSNSLPFILVQSHSSLDRHYFEYEKDLNTILNGLQKVKKWIPLAENKRLRLFYHCNVLVDEDLNIELKPKQDMPPFIDFNDYETRLLAALRRLRDNAQDPERTAAYGLVTTISKGYDSAACAALAKELGCDTAVTFDRPAKYAEDSGEDIAQQLGYAQILKKDAEAYLSNTALIESEFVSSGDLGTGIVYAAFEEEFKEKMVFVGHRGDYFWDKHAQDVNDDFRFNDFVYSGTSQAENRLKADYIFVPVPLYGAAQWPSIHKVTHLKEMDAYSVGGDYDRPIPRRIVETRGVDRKAFGFKKAGAGFNYRYDTAARLKRRMSPHSFQSFYDYYLEHKRKPHQNFPHWLRYFWNTKRMYSFILLNQIGISIPFKDIPFDGVSNPGLPSYLFLWGVAKRMETYQTSPERQAASLPERSNPHLNESQEALKS